MATPRLSVKARRFTNIGGSHRGKIHLRRSERGSVATEITLVAPALMLLLVFIAVLVHRGVDARLRVEDAAHQAARAATLERTAPAAVHAAGSTAARALAQAGVTCESLEVDTAAHGLVPGGTVTVTVSCSVDLADAMLAGPGRTRLSATASEPVDQWHGITPTEELR